LANLALVTENATNSQNGSLDVTYQVSESTGSCTCAGFGSNLSAGATVSAPPINGASCSAFNAPEKTCLSGPLT
jgi:hypothetical protein